MSKKETEYQLEIKKSVIKQGGFGFKLTNAYTVGVPDLGIWLPPFAPCIAEVKVLRDCQPGFDRKLEVSDKQFNFMEKASSIYEEKMMGAVAFQLIVVEWRDSILHRTLVGLPRYTERLVDGHWPGGASCGRQPHGLWDIASIMLSMPFLGTMETQDANRSS